MVLMSYEEWAELSYGEWLAWAKQRDAGVDEKIAALEAENQRLRKLINKYHLGILKVDDNHEIALGGKP